MGGGAESTDVEGNIIVIEFDYITYIYNLFNYCVILKIVFCKELHSLPELYKRYLHEKANTSLYWSSS